MWYLRRMEKVKWTEKITNEEVLNKTIQKSNIMLDISKRQISFFGHMMRKGKLEYLAVNGKKVGKRTRGGRRTLFTDQLVKWTNFDNTIELFGKHQEENSVLPTSFDTALVEEEERIGGGSIRLVGRGGG